VKEADRRGEDAAALPKRSHQPLIGMKTRGSAYKLASTDFMFLRAGVGHSIRLAMAGSGGLGFVVSEGGRIEERHRDSHGSQALDGVGGSGQGRSLSCRDGPNRTRAGASGRNVIWAGGAYCAGQARRATVAISGVTDTIQTAHGAAAEIMAGSRKRQPQAAAKDSCRHIRLISLPRFVAFLRAP